MSTETIEQTGKKQNVFTATTALWTPEVGRGPEVGPVPRRPPGGPESRGSASFQPKGFIIYNCL